MSSLHLLAQLTHDHEQGQGFIPNKGQTVDMNFQQRSDILFTGESGNAKIFLKKQGFSYVVNNINWILRDEAKNKKLAGQEIIEEDKEENDMFSVQRIDLDFIGSNESPSISSTYESTEQYNYFLSYLSLIHI